MKKLLMGTAAIVAAAGATPADARLQLSIQVGGSTFTCFDGQASCDSSPGANNLLVINQTVGGASVEVTLAQSQSGKPDVLQLSSSSIINTTGGALTIKLLASDNNFAPPTTTIKESGSLTFNAAVGSTASMLSFWADHANTQGANPTNTPGTPLFTATGTPASDPDSFAGTHFSPFVTMLPFSMTEGASLNLVGGASITGFNQSMRTVVVPEPSSWALLLGGFGLLGLVGLRTRKNRLAI